MGHHLSSVLKSFIEGMLKSTQLRRLASPRLLSRVCKTPRTVLAYALQAGSSLFEGRSERSRASIRTVVGMV